MNKPRAICCAAALALMPGAAMAQTTGGEWVLPDPQTIAPPDMKAGTELDASPDPKYFYFHKRDVSFETAAYDIRECLSQVQPITQWPAKMPGFAVIDEVPPMPPVKSTRVATPKNNQMGLLGMVLAPILIRSNQRRHHQSIMRICMGYKGYARYPTTREAYIALVEGEDPMRAILMQARLASGIRPDGESAIP